MTTITAPTLHSNIESVTGLSYVLLAAALRQELAERFDPIMGGWFGGEYDFAGRNSDTGRETRVGGLGFATQMTAITGEVDAGSVSTHTRGYDAFTFGRKHLAYEESFQSVGLSSGANRLRLEDYPPLIVDSLIKTYRKDICTAGAAFATNVADASATFDVDDVIALIAAATATEGFAGNLSLAHKNRQIGYLVAAIRQEASLKFPEQFDAFQRLRAQAGLAMQWLGISFYGTTDVSTSSGDDFGFAWTPETFVRTYMSTADLGDLADANPTYVPEYGLVLTRKTEGSTTVKRIDANAFIGVGVRDTSIAPHWLVRNDDGV